MEKLLKNGEKPEKTGKTGEYEGKARRKREKTPARARMHWKKRGCPGRPDRPGGKIPRRKRRRPRPGGNFCRKKPTPRSGALKKRPGGKNSARVTGRRGKSARATRGNKKAGRKTGFPFSRDGIKVLLIFCAALAAALQNHAPVRSRGGHITPAPDVACRNSVRIASRGALPRRRRLSPVPPAAVPAPSPGCC